MLLFVLLLFVPLSLSIRDQAYAVRGRLRCGTKPAVNVRVKLWEEDTGPDPDDLLDSGYTDSNGEFRLAGSTAELTPIDPIFKVYHDCDDGIKPGKRKVKFRLPKSYITSGKIAKKEFDIGILNLETIFPKEERELIVTRRRRHRRREMEEADYDRPSSEYSIYRHRRGGVNADYLDTERERLEEESDLKKIQMLLFAILLFIPLSFSIRDQAYAVRGRLLCGTKPAVNVRVKLWEEDTGPDPDDLLDSGYTDSNGEFRLAGSTAELTPIDPIFKVYHDCDDGIKPGKRKVKFPLPKSYITNGKIAKKEFDIGVLNLETIFMKEERELIVTRRRRHHRREMEEDEYGRPSSYYTRYRHRRGGANADYLDTERGRFEEERIFGKDQVAEREGKNPC